MICRPILMLTRCLSHFNSITNWYTRTIDLDQCSRTTWCILLLLLRGYIYTHRQKLSNTTFFRRHCFGSCKTEYVGNGNQIFWILFQILLLFEHLEVKMILSTKYLDNLRPFTKYVKNDKEKQWKIFEADVWKIFFSLSFHRMEPYHPEHKLVYYKFLKNLFLWRT